jgi:hypothetical protein
MLLRRGTLLWAVLTLLAAMPGGLSAQTTFATITGTVTDPAGAVVPGRSDVRHDLPIPRQFCVYFNRCSGRRF